MKKQAFSSEQYLNLQRDHILERINQFDGKLYLEFGGKMLEDFHAARVLPGYEPDNKIKLLQELKEQVEVVIAINASNIEHSKARGDLGISYDQEVLRLIDKFNELGILLAPLSSHSTLANLLQMPSVTNLRKMVSILIFIIQSRISDGYGSHHFARRYGEKRLHQNQSKLDCRNRSWTWFWKIGNLYVQYVPRPDSMASSLATLNLKPSQFGIFPFITQSTWPTRLLQQTLMMST